ncbi:hypothetical protein [Dyadobacter psychrotolerans]|uniref:Lipoprotein n=1 Tax=Dyadobacter psychrotolerans TaxID=2541721 RepID=A0A4R5D4Q5_9BACT|nr:hypothetical protein [Dyadobacter psychrotolerans]TDE08296.1 hypothetical protein E0F88_32875 [Dyadobacter psychrotolerans]
MKSRILYVVFFAALLSCAKNDKTENPQPCDATENVQKVKVGDKAHGGVVFYVDDSEKHGMVMPLPELLPQYNAAWWPDKAPYLTPGNFDLPTQTSIGNGKSNTDKLMGTSATPYIAGICDALVIGECFSDWYLPSVGELQEIYKSKSKLPGVTLSGIYFSSNLEDAANAGLLILNKAVDLSNGTIRDIGLTNPQLLTRFDVKGPFIPIRSF